MPEARVTERMPWPRVAYGDDLTPREWEVLALVCLGKSNQEIAAALVISVKTVETHLYRIFQKLDVVSRTQAMFCVLQVGAWPKIREILDANGWSPL